MANDYEQKLLTRREVLRLAGVSVGGLVLRPISDLVSGDVGGIVAGNTAAMLYDATKCVGCRTCEAACRERNNLPPEPEPPSDLTARTWTLIKQYQDDSVKSFRKYQCMHCEHPACVSVCPVQALHKLEKGPVVYDSKKCIGCRYCMAACPFHVPRIDWDKTLPVITKCDFCADRIVVGLMPACAAACPVEALTFGTREQVLEEARARIEQHPEQYIDHVYGETEAGGTSWMYLSPIPFEKLGFPELESEPVPELSENVAVYGTPSMLIGVAALLGGVCWVTRRQTEQMSKSDVEVEEEL
jgi:formate dehydrogenase iron-sulfur subunit